MKARRNNRRIFALSALALLFSLTRAVAGEIVRGEKIDSSPPAVASTNTAPAVVNYPTPPWIPRSGPPTIGVAAPKMSLPTNLPAEFVLASGEKFQTVSFARLSSFSITPPMDEDGSADPAVVSEKIRAQIPAAIQSLTEKSVAVTGFMLPVYLEGGLATDFLILKSQSACCYGVMPKMNEWVVVRTSGKGVKVTMDVPVTALGTLHVGALRENGLLIGIYQLDCDRIVDLKD